MFGCFKNGEVHLTKWWDDAVDQELSWLKRRMAEQNESIVRAFRYGGGSNPALESIRQNMRLMREEIDDLKERLVKKESEIDRLKDLLSKW